MYDDLIKEIEDSLENKNCSPWAKDLLRKCKQEFVKLQEPQNPCALQDFEGIINEQDLFINDDGDFSIQQ